VLTIAEVQTAIPSNLRLNVTQDFVDRVNTCVSDPEAAEYIRENFISYTSVLKEGKYKTEDYLSAIKYASFKIMGLTNKDAYAKAFPDRYQNLVSRGASEKDISAYVAAYHRNKLVNAILERAAIPVWLLNQDAFQKAINIQLEIAEDVMSPSIARTAAANSILTHLKRPESAKVELDINVKETSGMRELKDSLARLAEQQRMLIQGGITARAIAHEPIAAQPIDAEFEEIKE
jgi:hypothetical protein